jgi:hypothetical protein
MPYCYFLFAKDSVQLHNLLHLLHYHNNLCCSKHIVYITFPDLLYITHWGLHCFGNLVYVCIMLIKYLTIYCRSTIFCYVVHTLSTIMPFTVHSGTSSSACGNSELSNWCLRYCYDSLAKCCIGLSAGIVYSHRFVAHRNWYHTCPPVMWLTCSASQTPSENREL